MAQAATPEPTFPKGALYAAGAMIALSITFAFLARTTDFGATRLEDKPAVSGISLRFNDQPDGSIAVTDATTGATLETLAPGDRGFVRVLLRSLAFDRARAGLGADAPFRLETLADGDHVLKDTATGRIITLKAFGWSNEAAFASLLDKGRKQQ